MNPSAYPVLVLNADYRPLSYLPLSLWSWQEAVKALIHGRVDLVECYDRAIHSPSIEMLLPSVVALKDFQALDRTPAFTRFNVFLRDDWTCQYCAAKKATAELTFDHVHPRSRGGGSTWENIVACCCGCNLVKADRTPKEAKMALLRRPERPTLERLNAIGRRHPPPNLHETWVDYLYWDSVLEA